MIVVEQVDAESPWEINSESNGVVNERFFRALSGIVSNLGII